MGIEARDELRLSIHSSEHYPSAGSVYEFERIFHYRQVIVGWNLTNDGSEEPHQERCHVGEEKTKQQYSRNVFRFSIHDFGRYPWASSRGKIEGKSHCRTVNFGWNLTNDG